MSITAIFDATAKRCRTLAGLKECYTVTGTAQDDGTLLAIPLSLDSTPVGALMPVDGALTAGNTERFLHTFELQVWLNAAEANPLSTLAFVDSARVLFRTDIDAGGTTTRLLMRGYGALRSETMNSGREYIVLPIRLEALETHFSSDYAV